MTARFANRYELRALLGTGGFSTVHDAWDHETQQAVALKVLDRQATSDPSMQRRFRREAAALATVVSPYVVRMLDAGEDENGTAYIAFEKVGGVDLSQMLRDAGSLHEVEVRHILRQLLLGLSAAHGANLLHRDIKAENIRVFQADGDPLRVKLLDFGLARFEEAGHPSITATGEYIGTPRYMAPEQLVNDEVTPRSDLYSVGLVAFELLCGRDALHGNAWTDQLDRLEEGYDFSADLDAVSPSLREVIRRLTAQDPRERYPTARAALTALDGGGAVARPSAAEVDRRPFMALGAAVVALGVVSAWFVAQDTPAPPPMTETVRRLSVPTKPVDPGPPAKHRSTQLCGQPATPGIQSLRPASPIDPPVPAYVPRGYDASHKHPLVIMLHSNGDDGRGFIEYSGFTKLADEHQFVIAAPDDATDRFSRGNPDAVARRRFGAREALELAREQLCIDDSRVYVVGHATDGVAAFELVCEPWVTAVATHAFRTTPIRSICPRDRRPYLLVSPLASRVDLADGDYESPCSNLPRDSIDRMEERLRMAHVCEGKPTVDFEHRHGECSSWSCEVPFSACRYAGGHTWPGGPVFSMTGSSCDGPQREFPMAEVMWTFFERVTPTPK